MDGGCTLAVVSDTQGGAVRSPGAMMAVARDGRRFGYLSGGCIDADAALAATQALKSEKIAKQRYGAGSEIKDLALPCGGAIEVTFIPLIETKKISQFLCELRARRAVSFEIENDILIGSGRLRVEPKLAMRIAGKGADLLALSRLAQVAGYRVRAQTPDAESAADLQRAGLCVEHLTTSNDLPEIEDDPYTAFVLMFHDLDWEVPLLRQALEGDAYYIGAVGSSRAQSSRLEALQLAGVKNTDRIHGPIGLVPSMRNASGLAISTLAELLSELQTHHLKAAA